MPEVKQDYELEQKKNEESKSIDENVLPVYLNKIKLSEEQEQRLVDEIFEEIDEIEKERSAENLVEKWDALDNQYDGMIKEDTRLQFNLNRNITKPIVDRVVNFIKQAFFESDPNYSVSPRPEYAREGGQEVCDKQQDFLDYKLDNLYFEAPIGKGILCAGKKGTGILKIFHDIKTDNKTREEHYSGKPVILGMDAQNNPIIENKGLKEFINNWPDAPKDYPGLVKKLIEGKDITFVAKYKEVVYNDPRIQFIELKNFFVRFATDGYEGLKETRLYSELTNMSYWQLKKEEDKGKFYGIDELITDKDGKKLAKYQAETFDIYECVYRFRLKEDDKEDTKILCWIAKDKKKVIGVFHYPYDFTNCLPLYIKKSRNGFYQPGLAEDITDSNIAQSVMLNLILGGAYITNTVTPITPEGSETDMQFLEKRWVHGLPINAKKDEIDFLQKYMKPMDMASLLSLLQWMKGEDEEKTQSSSLMSGGQTPLDPNAPASKTIALLRQAGVPIKEYISAMIPAFNELGYILLQIYYQASKDSNLKYRVNPERVVGGNPFADISRNELAARTTIQCQAYAFDFDKTQAKVEDLGLFQTIRLEPLIARNPEAVYYLLKNLIKSWSPKWRILIDRILPPLEQFKKMEVGAVLQGVAAYMEGKLRESQMTGLPPQLKAEELIPLVSDLKSQIATNPPEEVIKAQQKAGAE